MARPLTPQEKAQARQVWPRLDVHSVVVTDEATRRYNCLAWTLGFADRWVWPWVGRNATKADFDALYRSFGFQSAASGTIASFGLNLSSMTHGSISGAGHGPRWESKRGAWLRIQHSLSELEGGQLYGDVVSFYGRGATITGRSKTTSGTGQSMVALKLSKEEAKFLKSRLDAITPELRESFEKAYQAWKRTWDHPFIVVSSDPSARTQTPAFLELIAMGRDILPLLMEKLLDPDEFFALQAVDRLLRPEAIVVHDFESGTALAGEQARALETVRRWIALET